MPAPIPLARRGSWCQQKLFIVDAGKSESGEGALERASAAPDVGVPAPRDEPEDVREPVAVEAEPG